MAPAGAIFIYSALVDLAVAAYIALQPLCISWFTT
jgi:hypothetical protein